MLPGYVIIAEAKLKIIESLRQLFAEAKIVELRGLNMSNLNTACRPRLYHLIKNDFVIKVITKKKLGLTLPCFH